MLVIILHILKEAMKIFHPEEFFNLPEQNVWGRTEQSSLRAVSHFDLSAIIDPIVHPSLYLLF